MRSYDVVDFGAPLRQTEKPTPKPQGTEVLLRTLAAGVCHSDLHIWEGWYDLGGGKKLTVKDRGLVPPLTMGHEIVGEVAALGPEATGVKLGDKRLVHPWIGCGTCVTCRRGEEQLCMAPRFLGVQKPGGYGLMSLALLKAMGGFGAVVADIDPKKRNAALKAGALAAIDAAAPDAVKQAQAAAKAPIGAAIDFVGAANTAKLGIDALAKGGKYVIVGLFGGDITLSLPLLPMRAITIQGSYVGSLAELKELLALVASGKVPPVPLSQRPLDQANAVLEDLKAGRIIGRAVLTP